MNTELFLTEDQDDALREITNIGMGHAGEQLAKVLNTFVELSIPKLIITSPSDLTLNMNKMVDLDDEVTSVRQAFFGHWRGEALTMFQEPDCNQLSQMMGYTEDLDRDLEVELMLDVSNILVGACLNGIAHTLNVELNFSPPSLIAKRATLDELFKTSTFDWQHVLLMEVCFKLENIDFTAHLVMMISEDSLDTLQGDLDSFLEDL